MDWPKSLTFLTTTIFELKNTISFLTTAPFCYDKASCKRRLLHLPQKLNISSCLERKLSLRLENTTFPFLLAVKALPFTNDLNTLKSNTVWFAIPSNKDDSIAMPYWRSSYWYADRTKRSIHSDVLLRCLCLYIFLLQQRVAFMLSFHSMLSGSVRIGQ